jgi:outer membrane scaffolding protein for murein synthesis (MipA/OmpV family)
VTVRFVARALLAACSSCVMFWASAAHAEEEPLWEFGLGVGAIAFPDYRGSDEMRAYPVPVPYFVYRGPILKADRDGVRGELFDRKNVELSISVNATVPVDSEDNAARRGMPDLKPTVELGPSLEVHVWRSSNAAKRLDLVMPLRVPVTIESSPHSLDWTFAPRLNIDIDDVAGHAGWDFGAGVGPVFAADRFHEYYYSVPAQFATPERPEYHANGGYSGMQFVAALSKRFPKYWVGAFVRYDWLGGAEFDDSPLMRSEHSLSGGFGIAWMIRESKRKVEKDGD